MLEQIRPMDIERRSFEIITELLGDRKLDPENELVIKRAIHTTADFDYADNLVFSDHAVTKGIEALRAGCDIVTDTQMAKAGINKTILASLGGEVHCFMSDPDVAAEATGFTQVSMEQIYDWNPDILFVDGPGLIGLTSEDVLENRVEGTDFSSIKAVQDGRVYDTTLGMWNWFTPNPDAPLVFAWLACNTYPEVFADYPLEDTIREYYHDWYGYDVTDEEMEEMLQY